MDQFTFETLALILFFILAFIAYILGKGFLSLIISIFGAANVILLELNEIRKKLEKSGG